MKTRRLPATLTALLALFLVQSPLPAADKPAAISGKDAFDKMKSLAGEWRGTFEQPGIGPEALVIYKVTSAGSVVQETLFPGTPNEMVTMYHLDGDRLVLTHYCAAGNQPSMALTKKSTTAQLDFDFTGATNMKSRREMHMHSARLRFESDGSISAEWDSYENRKKTDTKKFFMRRKN